VIFFEQWQHLSSAILEQGTNNLSPSTKTKLRAWQQHALLLGFAPLVPLCDQLLNPQCNPHERSETFCQLLHYLEGLQKASVSQWLE